MGIGQGAGQAVQGLTGIVGGMIGGGKRRKEERLANAEYDKMKSEYQGLDTSNIYANMQNTAEDLTVNQQAAQFGAAQQQQTYGNTMDNFGQAAGGSGIAALAQAMAGQQTQNLQSSVADIGQQESANQRAASQQAASNQSAKLAGADQSRQLKADKVTTLFGMAQERKAAAKQARADATEAITSGIANTIGGAAEAVGGVMTGGASSLLGGGN